MRVWDTVTGQVLHAMKGHESDVNGVSLSADGRIALSGGDDGIVRVWDATAGQVLHAMKGHIGSVSGVSLSADGSIALSGGDAVRLWDALDGKLLHTMEGHEGYVNAVSLSADGRITLSGDGGWYSFFDETGEPWDEYAKGTVLLWDAATGKLLHTLQGHEHAISAVVLSADGRLAVSADEGWDWDGEVRVWDVKTGQLLHTIDGYRGGVEGMALSADGRLAFSKSSSLNLYLWGEQPVRDPPSVLHQAFERYTREAIGPAIPKPKLPPVPMERREQDPSETMAAFEQSMARARTERKRQIGAIEAEYRTAVQERNARVRRFEENPRQGVRLTARAKAVAEVYGHPVLKAQYDGRGNPRVASSANAAGLYITVQFHRTKQSRDWLFGVPPGDPTNDLQAALGAGEVSATTEYRLDDDGLSLVAVYAHHGDLQYKGTLAARDERSATQGTVRMPVLRIAGQGDQPPLLQQQNPNLKDEAFEQYEARQRSKFDAAAEGL